MLLRLTNTLTRKVEDFHPHDPQRVSLYVCGITPQEAPHLGHGRGYTLSDVLFRLLRTLYGADHVLYVRNYTDVDDKIIELARQKGLSPEALAEANIQIFEECMVRLNTLPPTAAPRVTQSIPEIVAFIGRLEANGIAYRTAEGDVYYDLAKLPACGCGYHYGQLSGKKPEELIMGSRVEPNPLKHNPGDFALWKAAKPGEPSWASPWGQGRPGWHIECSAMSLAHVGPKLDLHGGGEDLQFPHHENELAQNIGAFAAQYTSPQEGFARLWFHWAFITVNGTKMSKSLGNFTYLHEALETYGGAALRYWLLQTHYRKPVDYSAAAVQAAGKPARRLVRALAQTADGDVTPAFKDAFLGVLCDDLNTAKALALLNTALARHALADVQWGAALLGFAPEAA